MTKIILAFPCMGKTYYAQNHPEKALITKTLKLKRVQNVQQ